MKTIEYRTIDKSSWPRGPWDDEPDKKQWLDPETGLPCLIVRHKEFGNLCGYVGVQRGHPFYEQGYDPVHEAVSIRVHGGLTFADHCQEWKDSEYQGICHIPEEGEPEDTWWFGFDCGHAGDRQPGMKWDFQAVFEALPRAHGGEYAYRDLAYVTAECTNLARQLDSLKNPLAWPSAS